MSDATDGRGLASTEFDDDEIEWDDPNDERTDEDESAGASPIESMVGESMDVVVPDDEPEDDDLGDDEFDEDEREDDE